MSEFSGFAVIGENMGSGGSAGRGVKSYKPLLDLVLRDKEPQSLASSSNRLDWCLLSSPGALQYQTHVPHGYLEDCDFLMSCLA